MSNGVEIELKLPLRNGKQVEAFLNKKAEVAYTSFQHDMYYNAPHRDFLQDTNNVNEWFRIRLAEGKAQINYKDWLPHDTKAKTHCKEFEANVDSYEQLRQILDALNFSKLIDVKKTRKAWNYADVEVSIDLVEGLGEYIELEYKGRQTDVQLARDHLFKVLGELGAKTGELDRRGYPYLLLQKRGLLHHVAA
jgi:adenylate cyclase, class 2